MKAHFVKHWLKYVIGAAGLIVLVGVVVVMNIRSSSALAKQQAADQKKQQTEIKKAEDKAKADKEKALAEADAKAKAKAKADSTLLADAKAEAETAKEEAKKAKEEAEAKATAGNGGVVIPNPQNNQAFVPPSNSGANAGGGKKDTTDKPISFKLKGAGANGADADVSLNRGQPFNIDNLPNDRFKRGGKFISYVTGKEEEYIIIDGHKLPARGLTIVDNGNGTSKISFTRGETKTKSNDAISFTLPTQKSKNNKPISFTLK